MQQQRSNIKSKSFALSGAERSNKSLASANSSDVPKTKHGELVGSRKKDCANRTVRENPIMFPDTTPQPFTSMPHSTNPSNIGYVEALSGVLRAREACDSLAKQIAASLKDVIDTYSISPREWTSTNGSSPVGGILLSVDVDWKDWPEGSIMGVNVWYETEEDVWKAQTMLVDDQAHESRMHKGFLIILKEQVQFMTKE